jgi:uncharacterized membrane-anchored protein YhcB (DUF1043 family)
MELGVWGVVVGSALFAGGLVLGLVLNGSPLASGRLRRLEQELREERERSAGYRESVAKHFGATSDLFRDLTRQYTGLYAHLAEGARELCPDRIPELGHGFSEADLPRIDPGETPEKKAAPAG